MLVLPLPAEGPIHLFQAHIAVVRRIREGGEVNHSYFPRDRKNEGIFRVLLADASLRYKEVIKGLTS